MLYSPAWTRAEWTTAERDGCAQPRAWLSEAGGFALDCMM